MFDSEILGPDGEPFNLTKSATDKGVWRRVGFSWTLSHEALRAQWPLAREIRVFFPTFIPLGVVQTWRSPNGSDHKFFRCVIAQSKPGCLYETDAPLRQVHVTPPLGFPFKIEGPITVDRTLVWWPPGEEGRTPGKYVSFEMYLEAIRQAVHLRDTQSPEEQHAAFMREVRLEEASAAAAEENDKTARRKERARYRVPKVFVQEAVGTLPGNSPSASKE